MPLHVAVQYFLSAIGSKPTAMMQRSPRSGLFRNACRSFQTNGNERHLPSPPGKHTEVDERGEGEEEARAPFHAWAGNTDEE